MPNEFDLIRSINRRLLSDIARKRADGIDRLNALNAQMADLRKVVESLDSQRSQIEAVEKIQAAFLQNGQNQSDPPIEEIEAAISALDSAQSDSADADDSDRGKLKARIGDQRYLVLSSIRDNAKHTLDSAIAVTGLPPKRVKDALKADEDLGVLKEERHTIDGLTYVFYSLTAVGYDLLERFETYKLQRGQKLPTRAEVLRDMGLEPPLEHAEIPHPTSIEDYGFTRTLEPGEEPAHSSHEADGRSAYARTMENDS